MRRDETPVNEAVFPAPPNNPSTVEFELLRQVMVRTNQWTASGSETVLDLGGFGRSGPLAGGGIGPRVDVMDKVWIPEGGADGKTDEKKQKGRWKQEVTFTSTFVITCSPTFVCPTLNNSVSVGACDLDCV